MANIIDISEFLVRKADCALVDVRSPSEFAQGHIPGAVNVPLFSDDERAAIGKHYKEQGREEAVLLGLERAGPKMRPLVEQVRELCAGREVLVHCWRGGMRSQSVAWLLTQASLYPSVLGGGYKRYRRAAHDAFAAERRIAVLAGMTGAGKTRVLRELGEVGEQVLDLEQIAHHRGSSFGAIGLPAQPTCEQFENHVFEALRCLDPNVLTWIEDESPSIGRVRVPESLWWMMRRSPALFLDVPRRERAISLAAEYGCLERDELEAAIVRLTRKLGGLRTRQAVDDLREGRLEAVASELLVYYDKTYRHAAERRPREYVVPMKPPFTMERLRAWASGLDTANPQEALTGER